MTIASEITDLQTNLANAKSAVTTKGGTVGDTGLAGLASEIDTIPAGGGGAKAPNKYDRIRFLDYDGTLLYTYTISEVAELTELPQAPTHTGMVSDGWTHTLAQVQSGQSVDVGATYHSSLGTEDTSWFLVTPQSTSSAITINFQQDTANGVTIDWGDGSATETVAGTGLVSATHTYATKGASYYLLLTPDSGVTLTIGGGAELTSLFGSTGFASTQSQLCHEALIGRAKLAPYALYTMSIRACVISPRVTGNLSAGTFYQCLLLRALIIPVNLGYDSSYGTFSYDKALATIVYSPDCTVQYGGSSGNNEYISPDVIVVPTALKQFTSSYTKAKIIRMQPKTGSQSGKWIALATNPITEVFDYRGWTVIPRTSGTVSLYPFQRVVVPDSLFDSWKTSSYWSAVADNIVKASVYEEGGGV